MKIKMYSVHDTKAAAYLQPWFQTKDALAIRNFADCVNDKNHNFGRHPEDYNLFQIGEFNDQNATIEPNAPKSLGNGIEFIELEIGEQQKDWLSEIDEVAFNQNKTKELARVNALAEKANSGEQT